MKVLENFNQAEFSVGSKHGFLLDPALNNRETKKIEKGMMNGEATHQMRKRDICAEMRRGTKRI
ncbi:hypothetical protein BpHYR1_051037 [Brachionus plicatilis]|uniref:Uncharacterized protein n=1 Tax=Brachionus plicatilis TaxID=10195 RepID=A0A3M7SQS1_BRAPC|nr:hypothetical protein BpHYR1_051037 [Brachionus plicatilis]